jgi:hypothetical protein
VEKYSNKSIKGMIYIERRGWGIGKRGGRIFMGVSLENK